MMVFVQYVVLPATRHHFRIFTFDPPEPLTLNIYRVGNLLFRSFAQNRSLQKSNRERIALVARYKGVTQANRSSRSLKKSGVSDLLFRSQKIRIFHHVFDRFSLLFLFYAQKFYQVYCFNH